MSHSLTGIMIPEDLANARITNFVAKKNHIDTDLHCHVKNKIEFNPGTYIDLLAIIYQKSNGYRAYFAFDKKGSKDDLTILFAITDTNGNNTGEFYRIINKNTIQPVLRSDAQTLTHDVVKYLDSAKKTNPKNIETVSIFYETNNLQQLNDFLIQHKNDLEQVHVNLAAYCDEQDPLPANDDDKKYSHQLAIIFELITKIPIEGSTHIYFTFGITDTTHSADTGVPCPPPPAGSITCPGA